MNRYRLVFTYLMDCGASMLGVPQVMRTEGVDTIEAKTAADAIAELEKKYPPESELTLLSLTRLKGEER